MLATRNVYFSALIIRGSYPILGMGECIYFLGDAKRVSGRDVNGGQ